MVFARKTRPINEAAGAVTDAGGGEAVARML
jgi:hypothetical protein